jgi:hypothetical protein
MTTAETPQPRRHRSLPRESTLLGECDALAASFKLQNTTLKTVAVAVSTVLNGTTHPAHCVIQGRMSPRTGIDGKSYYIGFEMRPPKT